MSEPNRFPDSVFDRIGSYLPAEHRPSYYRYVAHLRTLGSNDELMMLAEGMGLLALITRQVPEAVATEREKFLTELARLCSRHETATTGATANVSNLFSAHQKLLEQNIATWQNREQQAVLSLDRIAKRFEETETRCADRLQASCAEIQAVTKELHAAALKAQIWVSKVSFENRIWPCVACGAIGALVGALVAHFLKPSQ